MYNNQSYFCMYKTWKGNYPLKNNNSSLIKGSEIDLATT